MGEAVAVAEDEVDLVKQKLPLSHSPFRNSRRERCDEIQRKARQQNKDLEKLEGKLNKERGFGEAT